MLKLTIKKKFLLGTVGIVVGFGLVMLVLVRTVLYDSLYRTMENRGDFIARKLAQDSIAPVLTENSVELQMMINDLKQAEEDIVYIYVQGDNGEILAHTFGQGFPVDLKIGNGNDDSRRGIRILETEQGLLLDFSAALFQGAGGRAHVGMAEAPLRQEVNATLRLLLGGVLGVLALGAGMAAVLAISITKPIHLLAVAVEAMERGDLRARVPVRSDDEVGHLAAAFNTMAETREKIEEALLFGERRLRDITSGLGEGVLVVDTEGRLTFMNPEAERLLGWREDDLAGKQVHDIVHFKKPDGAPHPASGCPSMKVVATGERITVDDDLYIRKDGTAFAVAYVSAPIRKAGVVEAVVIAFQDITQRKQREAEREALMLEHMDALSKVKVLSGMLPICSSCKKIRDDAGYWKQIEIYIHDHSEAEFSHSICPDCAQRLYPDHYKKDI
ncbi:MAG: PAS domain S-box protein [Nitrospirota bacterium]